MIPPLLLIVALLHLAHVAGAEDTGAESLDPLAATLAAADAEVLALLANSETKLQAWGAWHAGARGLTAATPVLLDLIHRLRAHLPEADAPTLSNEERLLRIIACESLAQLRPQVDGPTLDRLLADGDQILALVLMAAEPERHRQRLWSLVHGQTPDLTWAAALNLLASVPRSDVAPDLLAATTVTLAVIVHDGDGAGLEHWTGGRSRPQGRMVRSVPGFPRMRGSLLLSQQAQAGSIVVAPGPTTIYLGRGGIIDLDRNRYRIAILSSLVPAISRTHPLHKLEVVHQRWAGGEDLRRGVTAAQSALAARWRLTLDALVAGGHLHASAAIMPTVRLELDDQREDSTQALPDLEPKAPPQSNNGF